MKKIFIAALLIFVCGCSPVQIIKESSLKANMKKYKVIHIGWIDYPAGQYRKFLYNSPGEWQGVIYQLNAKYLMKFFKYQMPDKKFIGPSNTKAVPGGGDLFIRFDFLSYEHNFNYGWGGTDHINLRVSLYDIKRGKQIYNATIRVPASEPGPGDWSVFGIRGRLEMEVRNTVRFIAGIF